MELLNNETHNKRTKIGIKGYNYIVKTFRSNQYIYINWLNRN